MHICKVSFSMVVFLYLRCTVCLRSYISYIIKGAFKNYVDKMKGGGGQKMSIFVHAQGIKTVHPGGGGVKNGKILTT